MGYIYKNDAHVRTYNKHNEVPVSAEVKEYRENLSKKSLEHLRMKYVYMTEKRQAELIGSLTLEDKIFYGTVLNEEEETIQILADSDIKELDGELTFGKTSFQDGVEIHTNNKY